MNWAGKVKEGQVGVIPTDTLYGVIASAFNKEAVERVYTIKQRDRSKPCIVLCDSLASVAHLIGHVPDRLVQIEKTIWPGPVSVVVPRGSSPGWVHRGGATVGVRIPDDEWLCDFLRTSGPLVAPSANRAGEEPATTASEAQDVFGNRVDFVIDRGEKKGDPSTLLDISVDPPVIVRSGQGDESAYRACAILADNET